MRIAFFSDNFYPELSGIAESVMTLSRELGRRGHHIRIFAPRYSSRDFARLNVPNQEIDLGPNVSITRFSSLPIEVGSDQGRVVIPCGFRLPVIKRFRPDVMHVHLPFGTEIEALFASRLLGVPMVGTNHTAPEFHRLYAPKWAQWIAGLTIAYTDWFYNRCRFVSSPANAVLEEMNLDPRVSRRAISNALKTDLFAPRSDRAQLREKWRLTGFTVLSCGRLAREKNVDQIIRAAAALRKQIPELRVVIVGRGPVLESLQRLVIELGTQDIVRFTGYLPHTDLAELYAAVDVFCIPSESETQSLVTMEAMLCGTPVVAAAEMGLKEYVKPGTGFLFEPNNIAELSSKILYLRDNPDQREAMGLAARKATEGFTIQAIGDIWESVYREVVTAQPALPRL